MAFTCHEFQWELVKSGQYDFRGLLITINRKPNSIQLYSFNAAANGLDVGVVWYSTDQVVWELMDKLELPPFGATSDFARSPVGFPTFGVEEHFKKKSRIHFRIQFKELQKIYCFCLVDWQHGQQLWSAATNRQFTDVEFVVCGKSFHAHRSVVAARSPYLAKIFGEGRQTDDQVESTKCLITNCDPSTFEQLLFFMYTGSLQASADNKDLLQAARGCGIATLQSICKRALEKSFQSVTDDELLCMSILMK